MIKKYLKYVVILSSFLFVGWGNVGHYKISSNAVSFFHPQMSEFLFWKDYLASHASDADYRKGDDPTEGKKHYIDIDNYSLFLTTGRIPNTLDSVIALYGSSFVYDQGVLPWATITTIDSMTAAFSRWDFEKALFFAADIGHYVGDGYMPLHITKNYNGQFTNQYGVHSRYESTMLGKYAWKINYTGDSVHYVSNTTAYIFQYLYDNYRYVDSVLVADKEAKAISGSTSSDLYYQKFWEYSEKFTTLLLRNASKTMAELIYTSWVNAGSPKLNPSSITDETLVNDFYLEQNYPNPFGGAITSGNSSTTIKYSVPSINEKTLLAKSSQIYKVNAKTLQETSLRVYDILGREVATLVNEQKQPGNYQVVFDVSYNRQLSSGVYLYKLQIGNYAETKKMIITK